MVLCRSAVTDKETSSLQRHKQLINVSACQGFLFLFFSFFPLFITTISTANKIVAVFEEINGIWEFLVDFKVRMRIIQLKDKYAFFWEFFWWTLRKSMAFGYLPLLCLLQKISEVSKVINRIWELVNLGYVPLHMFFCSEGGGGRRKMNWREMLWNLGHNCSEQDTSLCLFFK